MIGIYKITQKSTGKVYIGQSKGIYARWNQHVNALDSLSFHEEYRRDPTDFTFEILRLTDDVKDLDRLEKLYIRDYKANDSQYGFNATAGNGKIKEDKPIKMLYVGGSINRYMHSTYLKNIENKKILIIGNFKFCDTLSLYNKTTIITDDYDFICEDAEVVIKVSTDKELKGEINKMKSNNEKFDLIIANPPYNIGNSIINNCIDLAEESVVLMPLSKYKANGLYKHVLDMKLVDPKAFLDATITDNLCVCKLIRKEINQTFEEVELQSFDPQYREFYKLNQELTSDFKMRECATFKGDKQTALMSSVKDIKNEWGCHEQKFCVMWRAVLDGTHSVNGSAFDVQWNVKKEVNWEALPISYYDCTGIAAPQFRFIDFPTAAACANFTKFFYAGGKNGLMNALVKGMNKKGGSIIKAIPNIDWSVDRDYEHLTYEELLQIMREEASKK